MSIHDRPHIFIGQTEPGGQQFDAWSNQPLLLSIEQGGIDWPSSCRNGTCRTCFSKLESGQVRYNIEWPGLSAEEKEEGYVLPCVAYPCSDVVLRHESF
ncbi:MAG: ferredoxin [Betaproteobacteria bacterium HGW-Betaproteobacteria-18]|nr:MAG: ferredoxin [Betaproteobacteria bacterium HGW-Betaproteobacteria-18]